MVNPGPEYEYTSPLRTLILISPATVRVLSDVVPPAVTPLMAEMVEAVTELRVVTPADAHQQTNHTHTHTQSLGQQ